MPPGHSDISSVCGKCHTNTREQFAKGPHQQAMDRKSLSECVSCHSNHAIGRTSPSMLTEMCGDCHARNSSEFARGEELQTMIEDSERTLAAQSRAVAQAKEKAWAVEALEGKLQKANTDLLQSAVAQHTLSVREVDKSLTRVRALSAEVEDSLEEIQGRVRARKIAAFYVLAFFGWIACLLLIKRFQTADAPVADPEEYDHA
mgnify:FL=1